MEQKQFVGFDLSQAETSVCVVDGAGKVLWQDKCVSTPEAMVATGLRRAPHAVRIAFETGPGSAGVVSTLAGMVLQIGRIGVDNHILHWIKGLYYARQPS
jgi:hypothetical protein